MSTSPIDRKMRSQNIALFAFAASCRAAACSPPASSTGCGKALPSGQTAGQVYNVTIPTSEDSSRWALISIPPKYDASAKTQVILSFHGATRTADSQAKLDGLTQASVNSDKIVVYPQGVDEMWQGAPGVKTDDLGFTTAILDHIESTYCVDTAHIFATGKSQGGGFCGQLACNADLSKRIAAFAPVSGAFYISGTKTCDPDTVAIPCSPGRARIPFLEFHGGIDDTIAYDGGKRKGACLPSIPHYVREWAARDGLGTTNTTTKVSDDTVRYSFGSGKDEGLVQHVFDKNIGHDWPSTSPNSDNSRDGHQPATYNATPIILDFFSKHSL